MNSCLTNMFTVRPAMPSELISELRIRLGCRVLAEPLAL